jgi:nitrogen fixation/metabolism regulation signal transduction histidine kinase
MNSVNQQIQQLKIEITRQEQFFKTLLEHLATGILTYNEKGFIIHANTAAKRLLSADVLTHIQQVDRIDKKLYNAISDIRPSERRLIAFNPGQGEIQLSLKATSFNSRDGNLTILSIQDIKNELDEKELESWMKLIRVLMHEIMNSITPITSLSESLSGIYSIGGKPVSPEKVTTHTIATTLNGLNVISEQGRGLKSFVDSYRKLTRMPEPVKSTFRISELLNRVQLLYESLDNSNKLELRIKLEDPEMEIIADQNLISQVLINLVKNALEANEEKANGLISISSGKEDSGRTWICVADNGPGIPADIVDQIFVPFFTTRKNGSGIGLSVSRQIMRAHGGNLTVSSTPGKETVFCLSFT